MSYENRIQEIDNNYDKIQVFDEDSLFSNIYNFWCFANYLSMYYIWRFVYWFSGKKTETLNPIIFYDDSESYFEKLFLMKSDLEKLIKPHHFIKKKKKKLYL